MKIVSVINYKGGVGKTTVTANVAGELANRGYKVLMIDLDPQASLTFSFISPEYWRNNIATSATIKNWFKPTKKVADIKFKELIFKPAAVQNYVRNGGKLDLVASHLELINVDLELATQLSGANLQQAKENFLKVHRTLLNGINQLDENSYDIVLIDCPPNFNIVTKNALLASDYILIPAKPDYLSTMGIDYLKASVDSLIKDYNDYCKVEDGEKTPPIDPKIAGIVFTMVQYYGNQPIASIRPYIAQARISSIPVFDAHIRENKSLFAEAPLNGIPVILSDVNSSRKHIITEMEDFINEFVNKVL